MANETPNFDACATCPDYMNCQKDIDIAAIVINGIAAFGETTYRFGKSAEEAFGDLADQAAVTDTLDETVLKFKQRHCLHTDDQIVAVVREASYNIDQI